MVAIIGDHNIQRPCGLTAFLLSNAMFPQKPTIRADLGILYDRGVDFYFILDGQFVLGCPWLNLTDRGQYQTGLIFSTTTKILLVGSVSPTSHRRSPQVTIYVDCRWPYT